MVSEDIEVSNSNFIDVPNVTTRSEGRRSKITIFGSRKWSKLVRVSELFVSVISHESIHAVLNTIEGDASEALDEVASASLLGRNWRVLEKCARYYHGLVGVDKIVK
jgi:hypothetical protein